MRGPVGAVGAGRFVVRLGGLGGRVVVAVVLGDGVVLRGARTSVSRGCA
jgi:hypothetical protein